ncbi:hypothetical protein P6F26_13140 [Roseibacterium sp. SDUM158017]|nr:hypothetical protein [Roseibacterium sp. SDUM158017]
MRNAVGFYWTLPVPWAGFTELPEDIDAAAKTSRTIRYQRDLIRRHAKENRYQLVEEKVFLEIAPDRGSRYVLDALRPLEAICREQSACFLYVDFWRVQGWRGHEAFQEWLERTPIKFEAVPPDEIVIDGSMFDPHHHFGEWRERQHEWTAAKPERIARAIEEASRRRAAGQPYKEIADALNVDGIRSASGKPWNEGRIGDLLKKAAK